ncbi:MAG TPA: hypothetical protein P5260_16905 [Candidatus Competibacter sp.]|nr:hypothetical protein [Candidatus Competibacter sp.]HRX62875.1 hypothetical protein [Candidatus Competibacter sp.]
MANQFPRTPEQDDDDWLALLAGQPAPDAHSRTRREAELLRQAVLRQHAQPVDEGSDADPLARSREQLLFALRRAGPSAPPVPRRRRRSPVWLTALAAGLVGMTLLPLLWPPSRLPDAGPAVVSPPKIKHFHLTPVVRTESPAAAAQALAESLVDLGVAVQPVQQAESWFIDVQLPDPPSRALTTLLAGHGLRLPPDRRLRVEFAPKRAQSP